AAGAAALAAAMASVLGLGAAVGGSGGFEHALSAATAAAITAICLGLIIIVFDIPGGPILCQPPKFGAKAASYVLQAFQTPADSLCGSAGQESVGWRWDGRCPSQPTPSRRERPMTSTGRLSRVCESTAQS